MTLTDFYKETTKKFSVTITFNDATPDITSDTVTFVMKTLKTESADEILNVEANVATQGADGIAIFTLSATQTDLPVKTYYYQIVWDLSGGTRYVLDDGTITILETILEN